MNTPTVARAKHTQGPWHVSGKDLGPGKRHLHIGAKGSMMVLASMNEVHTDTVANARLIAEAPNLLEQLRRVEHTLSVHGKVDADTVLHVAISAAIRKAESAQ